MCWWKRGWFDANLRFLWNLIGKKGEMLGELRATRERALRFLAETQTRDLRKFRWRHPFLGSLNVYEWFAMIAAHELRHAKQSKEIARRLPKVVEISQNQ
jgi:DinB superfamily